MLRNSFSALCVAAVAGSALVVSDARANTPDSFFDIFLDLGECRYRAIEERAPTVFTGGGGTVQTEMLSMTLSQQSPANENVRDIGGGQFIVDSFFDIDYQIAPPGSGNFNVDSFFDIFVEIRYTPRPGEVGTFDTEILSMDFSGASPGPGNSTLLRLDPAADHHGHVTILKLQDPGPNGNDQYQIDSFFDIFYEVSFDGGATWLNSAQPTGLFESEIGEVPEPGSAALLLIAGAGLVARRRRG